MNCTESKIPWNKRRVEIWQNGPLCRCHQKEKENHRCYGGAARLFSKVAELRKNNSGHTLLLNAGDNYQGTIWYTILKYEPIVVLANMLNYTAISLGNHDFDDGVEGLVPFLQQVNFPVLSANIKVSKVLIQSQTRSEIAYVLKV